MPRSAATCAADVDQVVAVLDQQVRAEHRGQPPQRLELLALLRRRRRSPGLAHVEQVELGAEPLRRAPGPADEPLRARAAA